ncbi:chromosomal replication initiator protein DnaA [Salipiger aestuarii]|uniref:chromosomal replication initiator DnaA n=1 Tax=Salipiger aestuarii TaxID=568098 RepID=UPI00123A6A0C|nr:chromosomal replication initiator DnaA [Salipiger aestuarii]KAA8608103.1 chromosomal replication initiator protein DnaA [Salipiger aestuarii]KAA8611363.1 chromosomal replication initiator protein DnaA [Salipiger aestuarii]
MRRPRQLVLPLPVREALGREDYYVSRSNGLAVALLDDWAGWPNGKMILVGPRGAGKTHLAHVWAKETGAVIVPARDLPGADIPTLARAPVCVEDADRIATDRLAEEALFHLHNLALAERRALLLTASSPPRQWGLALPDLRSRMEATQTATLPDPDDDLLGAVIAKTLNDRGCLPAPEVILYLVRHMPRRFAAALALVDALDAQAMGRPKGITRALARDVLTRMTPALDAPRTPRSPDETRN